MIPFPHFMNEKNSAPQRPTDLSPFMTVKHEKKEGNKPSLWMVELKAAKTHTVLYQINRTEYYCQVDLPLSDYPLYGKQLVASRG